MVFSHEDGSIAMKDLRIWIAEPDEMNRAYESLLGRDLLSGFTLTFVQPSELRLEPR